MTVLTYDIAALVANSYGTFYVDADDRCWGPSINVSRGWREEDDWKFSISHSSSSSSEKNEEALTAVERMVANLTNAADTLRDMMARVPEFEAAYQQHRAEAKAAYEAECAAKQMLIDLDTQLTPQQIGVALGRAAVELKHSPPYSDAMRVLELRKRGGTTDDTVTVIGTLTNGGAVQWRLGGSVISLAKLKEAMANYAEIVE